MADLASTYEITDFSLNSEPDDGRSSQAAYRRADKIASFSMHSGAKRLTTALGVAAAAAVSGFISPTAGFPVTSIAAEVFSPMLWGIRLPRSLQAAVEEMESYRGLQPGWDGVGSVAPDDSTISIAEYFLALLPAGTKAPEAMASADGD